MAARRCRPASARLLVAVGDAGDTWATCWAVSGRPAASPGRISTSRRGLNGAPQDPAPCCPLKVTRRRPCGSSSWPRCAASLAGVRDVVLVGTTLHDNAGDSLIWLGQLAVLAELGIRVHAVVHPASFDRQPVRRRAARSRGPAVGRRELRRPLAVRAPSPRMDPAGDHGSAHRAVPAVTALP